MFKVDSNTDRLNYGEILLPPDGYTLVSAIGTTYSLDLEALTAIAISLGLSEETDSSLLNHPISMLNALQKVSDRILIFCEAGQIKLPASPGTLCLILEKMVFPVALPYDNSIKRYPAFHPKMWLLTYASGSGDKRYRFVILSRNLTFDRSWDISAVLDGEMGMQENEATMPIVQFLRFLDTQIGKGYYGAAQKKMMLEQIIQELPCVSFQLESRQFSDFQILPLGIGADGYDMCSDALWKDTFHELLIMSPFVTGSVISHFNDPKMGLTKARRTLITRKSELGELSGEKGDAFDKYVIKDRIYDGEDELSEDFGNSDGLTVDQVQKQDIHAKIFLRRKYSDVDLYLGSMNATWSAMNKNVEMVLRLRTKNRFLNTELFLKDIFGTEEKENPFELVEDEITVPEKEKNVPGRLEGQIRKLCRAGGKARVLKQDDNYQVQIRFTLNQKTDNMTISPLRSGQTAMVENKIQFDNLDLLQLSEFYKITATEDEYRLERVIMIPTSNLPKDRDKAVVKSVVKDKKSFVDYVAFVLGEDYIVSLLESKRLNENGADDRIGSGRTMPALYEKMLKTALEEPEKLKEIQSLLKMIDDENIVPDEFRQMYETFLKTLKL